VDAPGVVNPPPAVAISNYPSAVTVCVGVVFTCILLFFVGKFDPTRGPLTISILIVLAMMGTIAYVLVFTVPQDDITPAVVGALSAGFGAVVAYWLGRAMGPSPPPE
jgi:ATP/ADP translocase